MKSSIQTLVILLCAGTLLSCSPDNSSSQFNNTNNTNNINNTNNQVCLDGIMQCVNNVIQKCVDAQWTNDTICGMGDEPPICDYNFGSPRCAYCQSGGTTCGDNNSIYSCDSTGNVGALVSACDSAAGEDCVEVNGTAACDSPCLRASATKSYRGCDYWAVTSANSLLSSVFDNNFALVVDNSNDAEVTVNMDGPAIAMTEVIEPHTLRVFQVPFTTEIKYASAGDTLQSGIYRKSGGSGAIHITTSLPITLYQFSPYDFTIGGTFSYTNDASLSLPTAVLSTNYLLMSRPTWARHSSSGIGPNDDTLSPGFSVIVGTEDNTTVNVSSSAHVAAGPEVSALSPGTSGQYQLNKGDVL
ncbi:IgGFc-binding protein, partial [Myxococcota bacterium]|nr:IgGFc-binding protein [Myxococcota bacterium]